MQSVKDNLKLKAINLRRKGDSYSMIEKELGVPKATMSGWFRDIKLPKAAQKIILGRKRYNLEELRRRAYQVHESRRVAERKLLQQSVGKEFLEFCFDHKTLELLLTTLYLGEGFKGRSCLGLGNSSPDIMKMFVNLLRTIYEIDEKKFRCYLHLRMDQVDDVEKLFWSEQLKIPLSQFRKTQFDERTINTKTWLKYHGVCIVYYYDASLEKRLIEIQKIIFSKI